MRLICKALSAEPIVFRGAPLSPKDPMEPGDENAAQFDDGIQVVLKCTPEHFRVSVLNLYGEPRQDGRNFAREVDARRAARELTVTYYPGGSIRTVLVRGSRTVTYTHTPKGSTPC